MAALVASEKGADVVVLEATAGPGGGTALSHRGLRGAGTRYQRAAGVDDSPEVYAAEIMKRNSHQADVQLTRALTKVSARMIEYLADAAAVDFHLDDFTFGQKASRSHIWDEDRPITEYMYEALTARPNVEFRFNTSVESLDISHGEIVGVVADGKPVAGRCVLLASGGFGGSPEMIARHIPSAVGVAHPGHDANKGEGIDMAMSVGAVLEHMDSFQPYPAHVGPGKRGVPPGVISAGGIVVDDAGRRFTDESRYPGGLARAMLEQSKQVYEIFDGVIFDQHRHMSGERSVVDMMASGVLLEAAGPHELAAGLGIDGDGLTSTLDEYAAAAGGTDRFGREVGRPLETPLYGIPIRVALYHTQGGVRVDEHARVLNADGSPVPNLYAGGGVASGVSGDGMDGYLPGNGLLASLGLGFIAGETVLQAIAAGA